MSIPATGSARGTTARNELPVHPVNRPEVTPKADRLGREIIDQIKGAIIQAKKATGQDLITVIGNTGTGKSTAINQWLGRRIIPNPQRRSTVKVADNEEEIAKIGHRAGTSETRYAHIYSKEGSPLVFADCGGFFDTRGVSTDIAVVTSLKLTLENAKSAKLILCFDSNIIHTDRAIYFSQAVNLALGTLLKDYRQHRNSIVLMFTKPKPGFDAEEAQRLLSEIRDDLMDGPQKRLYDFLLRDNGKYIAVCDPLSNESRNENLALFASLSKIKNTKEAFQTAYSANSQLKLFEEMTAIAVTGSDLYNQFFANQSTIARYKAEIDQLKIKITNITQSIQEIGNGQNDPIAIENAEKAIIAENTNIKRQQEEQINRLNAQIQEIRVKVEALNEKIALIDRRGEEEIEYWTDKINQEGINIEYKTITTTTHEKSGWFSSSSNTETTTSSVFEKRAIPRDFNYHGPAIHKVVKEPEGASWSNEVKTEDSYSVHYESGKGEPAIASVKVFIKRKNHPTEIVEKNGVEKEVAHEKDASNKLLSDIGDAQKIIHQADLAISAKGNVLEKLAIFKNSVKDLERSLAEHDQKLAAKVAENAGIEKTIDRNKEDFNFLKDYLQLSNDNTLRTKEVIAKFLTQDQEYRGNAS